MYNVKRRKFGNTGIEVSQVSFGAMNLRLMNSIEDAYKLLDYVLDNNINLIDTARAYNGENKSGEFVESEVLVGNAIKRRSNIKEPLVLVTKGHSYTPESFIEQLSISRQKLGIENKDGKLYIGETEIKLVYFFHGINEARYKEIKESNCIRFAKQKQKEGLFTYLGFSSHLGDGDCIIEAIDTGAFEVIELPFNIYSTNLRDFYKEDIFKFAYDKGIGIINMKAFNGNGYVQMYNHAKEVCDITYSDMLRFCLANPYTSTIDAGVKSIEEFKADLECEKLGALSESEVTFKLNSAKKIKHLLKDICRECMHCLEKFECPQKLNFPKILGLHAKYQFAKALDKSTESYKSEYKKLKTLADSCIQCGGCLEWCEYHLNIFDMLKQAHKDLIN